MFAMTCRSKPTLFRKLHPDLIRILQDYEVVVLVGAGIGVTPFASVLADLVHRMELHKCRLCGEVRSYTRPSDVTHFTYVFQITILMSQDDLEDLTTTDTRI